MFGLECLPQNPVFNRCFKFMGMPPVYPKELQLRLFDADRSRADDLLGVVRVPLPNLKKQLRRQRASPYKWYDVDPSTGTGRVQVQVAAHPMDASNDEVKYTVWTRSSFVFGRRAHVAYAPVSRVHTS